MCVFYLTSAMKSGGTLCLIAAVGGLGTWRRGSGEDPRRRPVPARQALWAPALVALGCCATWKHREATGEREVPFASTRHRTRCRCECPTLVAPGCCAVWKHRAVTWGTGSAVEGHSPAVGILSCFYIWATGSRCRLLCRLEASGGDDETFQSSRKPRHDA